MEDISCFELIDKFITSKEGSLVIMDKEKDKTILLLLKDNDSYLCKVDNNKNDENDEIKDKYNFLYEQKEKYKITENSVTTYIIKKNDKDDK